jgi:hypothetical protein
MTTSFKDFTSCQLSIFFMDLLLSGSLGLFFMVLDKTYILFLRNIMLDFFTCVQNSGLYLGMSINGKIFA